MTIKIWHIKTYMMKLKQQSELKEEKNISFKQTVPENTKGGNTSQLIL